MKIFISYSWENKNTVDEIDKFFNSKEISLVRDIRCTNYKDSFKEFMESIRECDFVIIVISDSYLKSTNCMYEVLELIKDKNYKKRILPVILEDAKVFGEVDMIGYIKYWKTKYQNIVNESEDLYPEEKISISETLKIIRQITIEVGDFISILKEMKLIPYAELRESSFEAILNIIYGYKAQDSFLYAENQRDDNHVMIETNVKDNKGKIVSIIKNDGTVIIN